MKSLGVRAIFLKETCAVEKKWVWRKNILSHDGKYVWSRTVFDPHEIRHYYIDEFEVDPGSSGRGGGSAMSQQYLGDASGSSGHTYLPSEREGRGGSAMSQHGETDTACAGKIGAPGPPVEMEENEMDEHV